MLLTYSSILLQFRILCSMRHFRSDETRQEHLCELYVAYILYYINPKKIQAIEQWMSLLFPRVWLALPHRTPILVLTLIQFLPNFGLYLLHGILYTLLQKKNSCFPGKYSTNLKNGRHSAIESQTAIDKGVIEC